jgi:hypothetical protein
MALIKYDVYIKKLSKMSERLDKMNKDSNNKNIVIASPLSEVPHGDSCFLEVFLVKLRTYFFEQVTLF